MKKVLFDTNIVLDFLLDRKPFSDYAAFLFTMVERTEIVGYLASTSITTIYYLSEKVLGKQQASKHIKTLLSLFEIAPVNRSVLEGAVNSKFSDFEDAVIHEAAIQAEVKYIVSRDKVGFKKSSIPVYLPEIFIKILISLKE